MSMTTTGYAALAAGESWHYVGSGGSEPAFTGDWTGDLAFRIREAGIVDLVGDVSYPGGVTALGSEVFVLPSGYRPSASSFVYSVRVETSTDVVVGRLGITTGGSVVLATSPLTDDMQSAEFGGQFFLAPPAF